MASDDAARARYLRDRVMTASPTQRLVMLYDRLALDLGRAAETEDPFLVGQHVGHALEVLAELRSSLDISAGGPAENLASLYGFLLRELIDARSGDGEQLAAARGIVSTLREAWAQAGEQLAGAGSPATAGTSAGAWVG